MLRLEPCGNNVQRFYSIHDFAISSFAINPSQDGKLSKDEILEKYDVFVGSQATDFGEALIRHDEF